MTAVLALIILGAVAYVAYDIARITTSCAAYAARGDERALPADPPTAEEVGQPARGTEH